MNHRASTLHRHIVGRTAIGVAAFVLAALSLFGAEAQEPAGSTSAEPAAEPARLRSLEAQPPPDEKSERPSADEWKSAERVTLLGHMPDACHAFLVREWLQIRCESSGTDFAVLSGSTEGVRAKLVPMSFRQPTETESFASIPGSITIELPIRRGDRRIMQAGSASFSEYSGIPWGAPFLLISEQWLDDQPGPWVTVAPIRP